MQEKNMICDGQYGDWMRVITTRGGRRGGTGERLMRKEAGVLISQVQNEDESKDVNQEVGKGISDILIGSSNQLGLLTENTIFAQKDTQRLKDVMWERELAQVQPDSQREGKQDETIKLPANEGVEQETGRVGNLEDSEEQGKEMDISELIPETKVGSGQRPCLKELDQNTINRPYDRKDGVVKAGTGT